MQNRTRSIIFDDRIKYKSCFLALTLILIFSVSFIGINVRSEDYMLDSSINFTLYFNKPVLKDFILNNKTFTQLSIENCLSHGEPGNPALPIYLVKILIPQGKKVKDIKIVNLDIIELECDLIKKPIIPQQQPITIDTKKENVPFLMNTDVYNSSKPTNNNIYTNLAVGYCRGYAILSLMINPVKYIPNKGKVYYHPEICIDILLNNNEKVNEFYRNNFDDEQWVKNLVFNPEEIKNYDIKSSSANFGYSGGLCDSSDEYHYVIITTINNSLDHWSTNSSVPYNWSSLMSNHSSNYGFNCTLVTIQDINICSDYWEGNALFNDTAAHIREFCKDAYQDWGTSYILIGGDDEWIPAREMNYSYESDVDSDLYWSNLDNTFNADEDSLWGEEGDAGFDLYSELYIGRLTCDEPQDVSNWMNKSFYYANSNDKDYLSNAAFYGGDTGWDCQGDDFIEYSALNGTSNWYGPIPGAHGEYPSWLGFNYGFKTWNNENPLMQFNLSVKWTAESPNPGWNGGNEATAKTGLKNDINNDKVTLLSGIAHANYEMSLDVFSSSWETDYHNTKPFFIHDYGCHCGDMDAADDGVLHSMLFHSDTELAFGCVYNTCYGWGSFSDTNSSSALQQKLFWDYFFDTTNNSGSTSNWQLGKAMAYSKDTMAPTINWTYSGAPGSWRAIIQGCLLFGDPAQKIRILSNDSLDLYNEDPPNGSININPLSTLSVLADNLYHSVLNATWWSNSSGDWIQFETNYSINTIDGAVNISQINSNFSSYFTKYWWSVNLTNGDIWLNETYNFITRSKYIPSAPNNFTAIKYNNSRIDIYWTNAGINKTFIEYNTSSNTWALGQGNILYNGSNTSYQHSNLNIGTTYYYQAWSWNDTDNCWSNTNCSDNATTHNTRPVLIDENPSNDSTDQQRWQTCNVTINDTDKDTMTVKFYENTTGNWILQQTNTSVVDDTNVIWNNFTNASNYITIYWWSVNVTDGYNWTNETYHFKTLENQAPSISDIIPSSGSTGISKSTTKLSVSITDDGGDNFNWTIETSPHIGNSSENNSSSGIKSCSIFGLSYSSTYYWYVNVTDGISSTSKFFYFTVENEPYGNDGNNGGSPPPPPQNIPPNANAGGPYFGNVNEIITFDGSNSSDINENIVNFTWDFGDGCSGIGQKTTHAYSTVKNYTVILTVVDSYGALDSDIVIATIIESNQNDSGPSSQNNTNDDTSNEDNKTRDDDNDGLPNDIEENLGSDANNSFGVENVTINNMTCYMIDTNGDGKVDLFYNPINGKKSMLNDKGNGLYLIDFDCDGDFDYSYDVIKDVLSSYESFSKIKDTQIYKFEFWQFILVISVIILSLFFFFKKKGLLHFIKFKKSHTPYRIENRYDKMDNNSSEM